MVAQSWNFPANRTYGGSARFVPGHPGPSTTLPFTGTDAPVAVQIDWQNLLLSAACAGTPIDLPEVLAVFAAAWPLVDVDLFTTPSMAPTIGRLPRHVAVRIRTQSFSKNCDADLIISSTRKMPDWLLSGHRVVIASGDAAMLSLAAEVVRCCGADSCGFVTLPDASTARAIIQSAHQLGVLGADVLDCANQSRRA